MDNLNFTKSQHWSDFEAYINKLVDNEINKLIYTKDENEKSVSQGRLQAYKTMLGLKGQN